MGENPVRGGGKIMRLRIVILMLGYFISWV